MSWRSADIPSFSLDPVVPGRNHEAVLSNQERVSDSDSSHTPHFSHVGIGPETKSVGMVITRIVHDMALGNDPQDDPRMTH
jgi:hypothetical protein